MPSLSGHSGSAPRNSEHSLPGSISGRREGAPPGDPPTSSGATDATRRSTAYCSANDRNVPVLVRLQPLRASRRPSYRDARHVQCLDYGVRCTGFLCPLFDVPTLDEAELTEDPHHRMS